MAFGSEQNAVLTDPPIPVSNSPLLSYSSSSPFAATSTSRGSVRRSRKMLAKPIRVEASIENALKAMKASSPRHAATSRETAYRNWMQEHPSALSIFKKTNIMLEGKQIVVFLDYDGTLSPIVDDPDRAYMSEQMRDTVREVAKYFPTAIISGRCRDKVYDFVQLAELYYAGSHGMDIMAPANKDSKANGIRTTDTNGNDVVLYQPASEFLPMIDQVFESLIEKTKTISGALVENNKFCVSVHFRRVEDKSWGALAEQVKSVVKEFPRLRMTSGRKVLEIRPIIKWDKGKALEFLLKSLGLDNRTDVLPLYIGDDRTDEDAFKVLRNRGQGFGILVTTTPKETNASYTLKAPSEVMKFLDNLVKWKQPSGFSKV